MIEWIKNLFRDKYIDIVNNNGEFTQYQICIKNNNIRHKYFDGIENYEVKGLLYADVIERLYFGIWKLKHA